MVVVVIVLVVVVVVVIVVGSDWWATIPFDFGRYYDISLCWEFDRPSGFGIRPFLRCVESDKWHCGNADDNNQNCNPANPAAR